MEIKKELFGIYNERDIYEYTLTNSKNLSLSVITYGAIITKIKMPDKNGKIENITVNVNTLEEMIKARPFHGAIIGPVAGRITNGEYKDDQSIVTLTKNEAGNTLHGGNNGLDTKIWETDFDKVDNELSLILKTKLSDGEDGFPGDREIIVRYTLTNSNKIRIDYQATTNQKTIFSPTNHVYFNLNGDNTSSIHNHELYLNSDYYAVLDDNNLPTGQLQSVQGTAFDLRKKTNMKNILNSKEEQIVDRNGLDHPFALKKEPDYIAAKLLNLQTGRKLEMFTNCDAVVVYTHNHQYLPELETENIIEKHSGIALETSAMPDAVNHESFGSIWLQPREEFKSSTTYKFSIID